MSSIFLCGSGRGVSCEINVAAETFLTRAHFSTDVESAGSLESNEGVFPENDLCASGVLGLFRFSLSRRGKFVEHLLLSFFFVLPFHLFRIVIYDLTYSSALFIYPFFCIARL